MLNIDYETKKSEEQSRAWKKIKSCLSEEELRTKTSCHVKIVHRKPLALGFSC